MHPLYIYPAEVSTDFVRLLCLCCHYLSLPWLAEGTPFTILSSLMSFIELNIIFKCVRFSVSYTLAEQQACRCCLHPEAKSLVAFRWYKVSLFHKHCGNMWKLLFNPSVVVVFVGLIKFFLKINQNNTTYWPRLKNMLNVIWQKHPYFLYCKSSTFGCGYVGGPVYRLTSHTYLCSSHNPFVSPGYLLR